MTDAASVLREAEIRPDALREGQQVSHQADIQWLQERLADFVHVACPACAADAPVHAFEKWSFSYVRCGACETLYMSPRPSPATLDEFYARSENYAYWNAHIFPASEDVRREKIFRPRAAAVASFCERYGTQTRTLLEVGAGFGTFCEEIRGLGRFQRIIAVEPTPDLAASCRRRGLEVLEEPVERVNLPAGQVDVITSFETIEHLFSPESFVRRCADLLAPGGLLVLTCPNSKGFDIVVLGEQSTAVDNEHLNYFHPRSLAALVERCGLEVVDVLTPGKLDVELVRTQVVDGAFDLDGQPFLWQVLIEEWPAGADAFQSFLADNRLSSHLWLVARKPLIERGP